jgi:dUTP pyrophosphatase
MQPDEFLGIHLRSSLAMKYHLMLANSEGIIDSDYYNNTDNEGHILIGIWNRGPEPFCVEKGMRIAQAVFCKFLTADHDDTASLQTRQGGIGSTGI